jgi:RNA polymerase sigma factor (sigma-70 family)
LSAPTQQPEAADEAEEDRALMLRVQSGDEVAFGNLMDRWEVPVKAVIGRLVLNRAEAVDLAQETFVRLWQQRERYRAGAPFRPWVFAIAVNLARNRLRWWRRRPLVALESWAEGLVDEGSRAAGAPRLEVAERAEAVRDAVAALPLELREAIVLFEYEGLSQAEIAAAVGATPKAVETRLHRAREKLRRSLARWN